MEGSKYRHIHPTIMGVIILLSALAVVELVSILENIFIHALSILSQQYYNSIFEYGNINIRRGDRVVTYRERMRALREDRDLTQAQVAKIINKSQQGYNHIETGRAELKIEDLIKLCDFYKVSADYFIGRKNK